ncbi:Uncharacterized protein DBV15_02964 [Temnothorax longispinosus]|uniref:Uncharacterized protein n=1 Tax=Temnothorax longispinosus TaxID=300112 RepID=A0A4S2JTT1_9HYME|nr:Uncharacterized protein DBV15_02964 [Temnothorax longispinosus]
MKSLHHCKHLDDPPSKSAIRVADFHAIIPHDIGYPRESDVATRGDLDSLEGLRVPWTRGVAASRRRERIGKRTDGRTDEALGVVGRWASVRRSDEDGKNGVAARLATAWTTRVYGVVVVVRKVATNVAEQLNNLIDIIGIPNEIHGDNGEIEFEFLDGSLNPLVVSRPISSIRDPTKLNDTLRDKFAKTSMQLGLDVGVTSKKDTDENVVWVVDNRWRGRKNYIRLCKRLTDGSSSLMQKLRGKDCVKLPRSEFYLEPNMRKKDDTFRLVGLKIGTKTGSGKDYKDFGIGSNEIKQRGGVTDIVVEAPISDVSANYDESSMKVVDKFGTGLNIKMIDGRIANLLRDGKLSLSASTALKV